MTRRYRARELSAADLGRPLTRDERRMRRTAQLLHRCARDLAATAPKAARRAMDAEARIDKLFESDTSDGAKQRARRARGADLLQPDAVQTRARVREATAPTEGVS